MPDPVLTEGFDATFRFLGRALAASVLCPCAALRADDAEDRAVALVTKLGGKVTREAKAPGKPVTAVDRIHDPGAAV
ncbi:hypothetical protein [Frigoriglobus tundricola]|uniref:Alanyl-tRNA synthetase n=1 Tax=Frigoriglobus tundricola TaxID=2774151 RepID=A0A6M5YXX3_9BACT|nr:hypothetical protein [Frigoriglobus tundricola]QJW98738.1 Alanyl-tRNA synthetase [Frigoriglobus tundricola]